MPERIDARLEQLARRRTAVLAALPTTEQAATILRDLIDHGLPDYTEPADDPVTLPDTIPPAIHEELDAWERRHQYAAQLWAEDRFRLGFALGAGLSAELFLDLA